MIVDIHEDSPEGSVVVLAPGRISPWDLGRVGEDLADLIGASVPSEHHELPFNRAGELLVNGLMPQWALTSPDWTVWGVLSDGEIEEDMWPPGIRRFIWQSSPRLVWSPDPGVSHPGWHADKFCTGGCVQQPAAPAEGVPRDFLSRMKALFDPSGALETPEWLEGPG